jgi:hypothetical protein
VEASWTFVGSGSSSIIRPLAVALDEVLTLRPSIEANPAAPPFDEGEAGSSLRLRRGFTPRSLVPNPSEPPDPAREDEAADKDWDCECVIRW